MAIASLTADLMREALTELEQASNNHKEWAEKFHGTMISRTAPDPKDTAEEPHRTCRFGQWYYAAANALLHGHPGFAAIGAEHERMHRLATSLLRSSAIGGPISNSDYESFVAARNRLDLEIVSVRHEFEGELSSLDPLTGTPGRLGMLTKLREQHAMAARSTQTCVIAMMDLDRFKTVNDRYGHVVGDEVLIRIARLVASSLRPYDKVYRYGGEEFLICLPATDEHMAINILDRVRAKLEAVQHQATDRKPFKVTASFGLCLLDPTIPVEQSIDRADRALYAAKKSGRNRVVVWNGSADGATGKVTATPQPIQ